MAFRLLYDRHRARDRSQETWAWTYQTRRPPDVLPQRPDVLPDVLHFDLYGEPIPSLYHHQETP